MFVYYSVFIILYIFALKELNHHKKLNNKISLFLILFFSIFIGLRNEIGCDWTGYEDLFNRVMCSETGLNLMNSSGRICAEFPNIIEYIKFKEIGFSSLNFIIGEIGGSFYHLNFLLSLLFIVPLIKSFSDYKRPFLALLVSYPYLITVIGLGNVRQSISIALLMLCIKQLKYFRFSYFYLYSFISILFHYSSIFFIFLPIIIDSRKHKNLLIIKKFLYCIFSIFFIFIIFIKNNYFINKINQTFFYTTSTSLINPLLIWIMVAVPALIILLNYKYFKDNDTNKFWRNYSIIVILMIFPIFIHTTIGLRFLLYFIPIKIYCLSNLQSINFYFLKNKNTFFIITFISFSLLTIWLNFANHSYCYVPYKNLLIR